MFKVFIGGKQVLGVANRNFKKEFDLLVTELIAPNSGYETVSIRINAAEIEKHLLSASTLMIGTAKQVCWEVGQFVNRQKRYITSLRFKEDENLPDGGRLDATYRYEYIAEFWKPEQITHPNRERYNELHKIVNTFGITVVKCSYERKGNSS